MRRAAASFAVLLFLSACGGSTLSSSSIKSCHSNTDCPAGDSCQFSVYESCGSAGACIATPDGAACIEQVACGCNGGTETICLVNGNAPSPIESLGSCDGATQQQGFDASGPYDATVANIPDAADSSTSTTQDSGPETEDSAAPVDAADSAVASTYGSACNPNHGNADCTDAVYNQCNPLTDTCTKTCTHDGECPDPPTMGTCDTSLDLDLCN
jgi:hypothetical protein